MVSFQERISRQTLLFDGGMGALLSMMGIKAACPEILNATHPEVITGIHERYIHAGADVLITNSLGGSDLSLSRKGLEDRAAELTALAVKNARAAAGDTAYVALDIGPTGAFLYPAGAQRAEAFYQSYLRFARAGKDAGADFALLETHTDVAECRLACLAAREAGLAVAASFTFGQRDRTLTGGEPECCALTLQAAGAMAAGVNCSSGPESMPAIVRRMRAVSYLPLIVQPNAGLPAVGPDGGLMYPLSPDAMRDPMRAILKAGASAIGGCCGTTPEHIRLMKPLTGGTPPESVCGQTAYVCSARRFYPLPDARNAVTEVDDIEDLCDVDDDTKLALVTLDGMRPENASKAVEEALLLSAVPLAFRASDCDVLAAALHAYAGVAAVDAANGTDEILQMYGAQKL